MPLLRQPIVPATPLAHAVALFRQGKYQACEEWLRPMLAANPREHAAMHLLGVVVRERGDTEQAIEWLRKAVTLDGRVTAYHGNLGNAYLMSQQFAAARDCYLRVLAVEPASPLAHFGLGMAHLGLQDHAAAAAELELAVSVDPRHLDAQINLGVALTALGRHDAARSSFERAVAINPDSALAHYNFGLALKADHNLMAACRHFARAAMLDPGHADAAYEVGVVLHGLDRLDDAARALDEALKLRPEMVPALYERGQVLNRLQSCDEAAACFERAIALDPSSPVLYEGLARSRHLQGRCVDARELFAEAQARGADAATCQTAIGLVLQTEGDFDAATEAFRRAIELNPAHGQAHLCLALIDRRGDPAAHVRQLERLREIGTPDVEQQTSLTYALAEAFDKTGDHDAAFAQYRTANDLRKAQYPYDAGTLAAQLQRLKAAFGSALFAAKAGIGSPSERPVFVVGMPRSGTTLIEQILASHPDVHGHGELDELRKIEVRLPAALGGGSRYPECVAALGPELAAQLAEHHLARLERDAPATLRSVDKLPHNFERLGLIALLFPRARIIHCTRDALDTCLSNYFHDFASEHRYSYDMETLGRFHRYYQTLMAHWRTVLPNPILDVPYEDVVADQEGWSRRLIDFIGLPWDERCLAFHENERAVYTYSLWQVRQPIYTSSVQRWRPYARHLGPLIDALELPRPTD